MCKLVLILPFYRRVTYPQKLSTKVEADSQQKLVLRFLLRDSTSDKPMRVHQAFVRLYSTEKSTDSKEGREIIFVAEPDASHVYKFDMVSPTTLYNKFYANYCIWIVIHTDVNMCCQQPVASAAHTFGYESGDYNVELIVGDALVSNPFQWTLATVSLKFPEPSGAEINVAEKSSAYKQKPNVYTVKPEIKVRISLLKMNIQRRPVLVSGRNYISIFLSPPKHWQINGDNAISRSSSLNDSVTITLSPTCQLCLL